MHISVIMSVYNGEKFLREAVESILNQTYVNFEFIIINDGSTDSSLKILQSFNDTRIVILNNDGNRGLIYSLNKGIENAKGQFIARMDSDDIALPNRFETQLKYFDNDNIAVVCTPVINITELGNVTKQWITDVENNTEEKIKNTLPKENCIAHPTVMIKTSIAKEYKYNYNQKGSEDWDLWLRLIATNHRIIKTKEPLLKYRIVTTSITRTDNAKQSVELKVSKVRLNFIISQIKELRITRILFKAIYALFRSLARYFKINYILPFFRSIKRLLTINPINAYKQYQKLKQLSSTKIKVDLFFMFPYCHIGGAEKVHANIVEIFKDKNNVVFFTGISDKQEFLYLFEKHATCIDIGYCANYPLFEKRTKKIVLSLIHSQIKPVVFGCNNLFFYEAILSFNENVRVFDLMHDFRFESEYNLTHEFITQYFRCEKRIFISNKAIEQTKKYYEFNGAPLGEYNKLKLITNYVDVPNEIPVKNYNSHLEVLFVGRGTSEKRAHLFGDIAQKCCEQVSSIRFTAIGEIENVIKEDQKKLIDFKGPIFEFEKIKQYYQKAHLIVITSEREGFPMVIMEAMANGIIPLSTPVGDVPVYITNTNGFVCSSINEKTVIDELTNSILDFNSNRVVLQNKSTVAYDFAKKHFSKKEFEKAYRETLQ